MSISLLSSYIRLYKYIFFALVSLTVGKLDNSLLHFFYHKSSIILRKILSKQCRFRSDGSFRSLMSILMFRKKNLKIKEQIQNVCVCVCVCVRVCVCVWGVNHLRKPALWRNEYNLPSLSTYTCYNIYVYIVCKYDYVH